MALFGVLVPGGATALALDAGWRARTTPRGVAKASVRDRVAEGYGRLPLRFEANRGQVDDRVRFLSRGAGYSLFLTPTEAVLSLARGKGGADGSPSASGPARGGAGTSAVVRMRLLGANPKPVVEGVDRVAGVTNYVAGSDAKRWATGVPSFSQVKYSEAYPGIDLLYHGRQRRLEYDFVVAPKVDSKAITLDFSGAQEVTVDRRGDLVIATRGGELVQKRPVIYQRVAGGRRVVPGGYVLKGDGRVGFEVGSYDRSKALVIDPVLSYATYLGGVGSDSPGGIAVDSTGNAYVTGSTGSADFPTASPRQPASGGGTDAFVTKLNATGSALLYSTYLGGNGADNGRAIAVDATGAYVTGDTTSPNFPTASPVQATGGGGTDAFVAKLDPTGATLLYSTYLGGSGTDVGRGIAVDGGKAHVTGSTTSTNFPTANALQATKGAGTGADAFVARYNGAGSAQDYSTYLGGSGTDNGRGIAADASGAYVGGDTTSTNFPTATPLQLANGGGTDAFVTKVNAAGSALAYSTYLGGSTADNVDGIAVNSGSAYVTGDTDSANFPTAPGALQASYAGGGDAFVTKYDATGSSFSYSTFLGGGSFDGANGIAVDSSGRASVVGSTSAGDNFPARSPLAVQEGNADFFAAQVNAGGSDLAYSTPLGGSASDSGTAIAVDGSGSAYLTGSSSFYADGDFPTTSSTSTFQPNNKGGTDTIVAKIAADDPAAPLVTGLRSRSGPSSGGTSVEIVGRGFTGASAVSFGGTPAASFTVNSDTSLTAISPAKPPGADAIRVITAGGTSPANPVALFEYAEGSWTRTGSMNTARSTHTTTLLENGKVLVAGGRGSGNPASITSSELYDPKTGAWSPTGSLTDPRLGHSATLLEGPECRSQPRPGYCGKVLVAGGYTGASTANAQPVLSTAELYDPANGTWSPAGSLNTRRSLHAATLLKDGRVLVAGGRTCNAPPPTQCDFNFRSNSAEIYDPATNTWTPTGNLLIARHTNRAALLPDGRVLLPAGFQQTGDNMEVELYTPAANPAAGTWSSCPPPSTPTADCPGSLTQSRARAGGTLLPNGKVIVAAGFPNNDSSELYDPATGTWSATGKLKSFGRFNFYSALLPNGKFLLAGGGNGGSTAEVYDPATGQWSSAGRMSISHGTGSSNSNSQDAVVLSSDPSAFASDPAVCGGNCGKVLVTGNSDDKSTDLYTPAVEPGPDPNPGPVPIIGPSPGPGPGPGLGPAPALEKLTLSSLSVSPKRFRVRNRPGKKGPLGTTFRYKLSRAATVKFTIARRTGGRRVGSKCLRETKSNRKRGACTLYVTVGSFTKKGVAGANKASFSGRFGRKFLVPGSYRATVSGSAGGARTQPRTVTFRVVR